MGKLFGSALIVLSGVCFYLAFFVLSPRIISLLPQNDLYKIFKVLVYLIVGYCGGFGIPLGLAVLGIYIIIKWEA